MTAMPSSTDVSCHANHWEPLLSGNMRILRQDYGFDTVAMHRRLLGLADIAPGSQVLDVGTGSGWMALILAEGGHDVVAVDVDMETLIRTRGRWAQSLQGVAGQVRFAQADGQRLPFRSGTFDAVFSFDVLHHVPDCPRVLAELLRVRKPSGVFAVADLSPTGLHAVEEVMSRGRETHFDNGCRVDDVARILRERHLPFERQELGLVTAYIIPPVPIVPSPKSHERLPNGVIGLRKEMSRGRQ